MLIQFTVENHRSIKNSAVISFAASKDKSFEEYLLHPDEKKALLPVLAIYGANAAGKSNVLHAMMTMKEMVVGNAAKIFQFYFLALIAFISCVTFFRFVMPLYIKRHTQ